MDVLRTCLIIGVFAGAQSPKNRKFFLACSSIHQQMDHKIRIEGSRRSNVLKPGFTKSAEEPGMPFYMRDQFKSTLAA